MGHDLSIDCPHCTAKAGELCTETCTVNGARRKQLEKLLAYFRLPSGELLHSSAEQGTGFLTKHV